MEQFLTFDPLYILALFTAPWIILALLAAFGDSSVGYLDEWLLKKLSKQKSHVDVDAPGRLLLISGFFGYITCFCAFIASLYLGEPYTLQVPFESLFLAIAAGILEVTWMIPYFNALYRGGAINTTPLFQTIPIFSLIIGMALFNETPALPHIIATIFIIVGAMALNYSPQSRKMDVETISLMLTASAVISFGYFLFKDASLSGNFVASLFGNGLGMGLFSTAIWIAWPPYRRQFSDFVLTLKPKLLAVQVGNEGLYALSTTANQLAVVLGPSVMMVTALNAFHPIFTLLIGIVLAKIGSTDHAESFKGGQLFIKTTAIVLIAVGTVLLANVA